jgi:hypothetical protein
MPKSTQTGSEPSKPKPEMVRVVIYGTEDGVEQIIANFICVALPPLPTGGREFPLPEIRVRFLEPTPAACAKNEIRRVH